MIRQRTLLFLTLALFGLGSISCSKEEGCTDPTATNYDPEAEEDNGSCEYDHDIAVPSTYSFEHVDYSGQTARIELLDMLSKKVAEAENGNSVTKQELLDIYRNNGALTGTSKKLSNKTYPGDTTMFLNWFQEVENFSGSNNYVIDGYFVNDDSVELKQVIEKGLMGACFYWQATDKYLEDLGMDDNQDVERGKGTVRAHHFDEGFGYFGAPKDFSASSPTEVSGDYTGSAWFWGKYCIGRNDALANLDPLFEAFRIGRTAIVNGQAAARESAVKTIEEEWERICAGNMVHYLKSTKDDMQNNDVGAKVHHWSEAFAFHLALKYNTDKIISNSEWNSLGNKIGDKPGDITQQNIDDALDQVQSVYGFSNGEMQNL